jgi:hypothetical protein
MNTKRAALAAAGWLGLLLCVAVFPRVASMIADSVPFAHLVVAPFGSTLISTTVFAIVSGWQLLSWQSPSVIDRTARSIARVVVVVTGLAWVTYVGVWLLLYSRGGP